MQYNKKSVEDIDVSGKKVIARCDFNVPQDENGNITDDKRIRASLETINYLLDHNAAVILCSHLGRPKGEVNMKYSLAPVAKRLSELLGKEVKLAKDVVGEDAKKLAAEVKPGEVVLLENVRFEKGETKNDAALAKAMADMADIYVNDAFGTAHRAHASTAGIADYLPAVCGFLIKKEISIMGKALSDPARPFVAILGGAKVSDKIGVIENLIDKCDTSSSAAAWPTPSPRHRAARSAPLSARKTRSSWHSACSRRLLTRALSCSCRLTLFVQITSAQTLLRSYTRLARSRLT